MRCREWDGCTDRWVPLYAGRALKLRNRLQRHGLFRQDRWEEWCEKHDDVPMAIWVLAWLIPDPLERILAEQTLISVLHPVFNVQHDLPDESRWDLRLPDHLISQASFELSDVKAGAVEPCPLDCKCSGVYLWSWDRRPADDLRDLAEALAHAPCPVPG